MHFVTPEKPSIHSIDSVASVPSVTLSSTGNIQTEGGYGCVYNSWCIFYIRAGKLDNSGMHF